MPPALDARDKIRMVMKIEFEVNLWQESTEEEAIGALLFELFMAYRGYDVTLTELVALD